MTENQWPQNGSYGTPGVAQQTAVPAAPETAATYPTTPATPSKTESAKHEAEDVAHQATDSAQHVAETAKAEAANVAGEVKANAKDLLYQAKTDLATRTPRPVRQVAGVPNDNRSPVFPVLARPARRASLTDQLRLGHSGRMPEVTLRSLRRSRGGAAGR
jgi:hypothetical protein